MSDRHDIPKRLMWAILHYGDKQTKCIEATDGSGHYKKLVEEIAKYTAAEADKARREEYIIHEVHGVGGRTINGETLYWAKVRKAAHLNTQESEDTDE